MTEKKDVWTRNQEFGGVGEAYDFDKVEVEEADDTIFCGFEADVEVDVEKQLDDEFESMEQGNVE